jgi:hypothetical protein
VVWFLSHSRRAAIAHLWLWELVRNNFLLSVTLTWLEILDGCQLLKTGGSKPKGGLSSKILTKWVKNGRSRRRENLLQHYPCFSYKNVLSLENFDSNFQLKIFWFSKKILIIEIIFSKIVSKMRESVEFYPKIWKSLRILERSSFIWGKP